MSDTKRRRSANGQRVRRHDKRSWYWECDLAHQPRAVWWDRVVDQDEAYAALDRHNAEHHPELAKGDGRG